MNTTPTTISAVALAAIEDSIREIKNEVKTLAARRKALLESGHLAETTIVAHSVDCPDNHETSSPAAALYWQYYETDAITEQLERLEEIIAARKACVTIDVVGNAYGSILANIHVPHPDDPCYVFPVSIDADEQALQHHRHRGETNGAFIVSTANGWEKQ